MHGFDHMLSYPVDPIPTTFPPLQTLIHNPAPSLKVSRFLMFYGLAPPQMDMWTCHLWDHWPITWTTRSRGLPACFMGNTARSNGGYALYRSEGGAPSTNPWSTSVIKCKTSEGSRVSRHSSPFFQQRVCSAPQQGLPFRRATVTVMHYRFTAGKDAPAYHFCFPWV